MPVYEYFCPNCSKTFEFIQKFSDPPESMCPNCEGPIAKQMSLTSFSLKGQGWYSTDYKASPKKEAEQKSPGVSEQSDLQTSVAPAEKKKNEEKKSSTENTSSSS